MEVTVLLALLLPIALLLALRRCLSEGLGWRLSLLAASTLSGAWLLLITELLSPFQAVTRGWLVACWVVFCLVCVLWPRRSASAIGEAQVQRFWPAVQTLDLAEKAMLGGIAAILAVTGALAVISPPNTDDVMEYHLPRVVLWASNQSVQFFPSFDFAQLIHTPWAEYAALHVYVLSGSDRCINLIEWFSFLGCIVGASLIAEGLGAGVRGQMLAAALCAALPELILESSGANNTAVGAFWIAAAVVFLLSGNIGGEWTRVFLVGCAMGLAVLTKGTAMVFLPPVLLAAGIILKARISVALITRCAVVGVLALLINLPQFVRNYGLTGTPVGLPFAEAGKRLRLRSEIITPTEVISGVIRNADLHLSTPSDGVNARIERASRWLIRKIGADPDDPRTTWSDDFRVPHFSSLEYWAGNPGQFLLLIAAMVWGIIRWRTAPHDALLLLLGAAVAFVLFCASTKWQPAGGRYHLALFVLGVGALGRLLPAMLARKVATAIGLLALIAALPFVFGNGLRSLLPAKPTFVLRASRNALYFADDLRQSQETPYLAAADDIAQSGCREVGIDAMLQAYVYPMMILVEERVPGARFQYTGVENMTTRYAAALHRSAPCAVVCLGCMKVREKWTEYRGLGGHVSVFGDIDVFRVGGRETNDVPLDVLVKSGAGKDLLARMVERHVQLESIPTASLIENVVQKMPPPLPTDWEERFKGLYELKMRNDWIWQWSEPLRERAAAGTADSVDWDALLTVDEALEQLNQLFADRLSAMAKR